MESFSSSKISQTQEDHQQLDPQPEHDPQSLISTLPRANGWLSSDEVFLHQYQGFWYWAPLIRGALEYQDPNSNFIPSPSDIIICSNPKSGTTWLGALAFATITRTRFDLYSEKHPLLTTNPHALNPTIEKRLPQHFQTHDPEFNLLATHMPLTSLPKSWLDRGCKKIYICRDPKDAFVSLWHYMHKMTPNKDVAELIPLEEAFDLFSQGISFYGPYWDHVLGYWKASLDRPDKVLFLRYEAMMQDTVSHVKRLAEFVGCPFSDEEEKEGVIARIVEMCSFESLSNLEVNKSGTNSSTLFGSTTLSNDRHFRKGKVGDWRNYLTIEMADKIDQIAAEKLDPFGFQI